MRGATPERLSGKRKSRHNRRRETTVAAARNGGFRIASRGVRRPRSRGNDDRVMNP
jgi:hypothetical protein